ncbi:GTPase Era [Helicobacter sp. 23-1045]
MKFGELECKSMGNSSLGASFALLKFFGRSQTASLVSHPKNFKNTKSPPQILELFLNAESNKKNGENIADSANAESNKSCHIERSEISQNRDSSIASQSQNDKNNPSSQMREDKSQSLPLPCGGGLRGWVDSQKNSSAKFSNSDFTHPLAPSAREGEQKTNCAQDNEHKTKCGFIALIGRPNAGKSTLLNALINENLALTSHKVNATRKQCNIIVTHNNAQMIFIDTPGLHKSQKLLNALMVDESHKAIESSDIVAFLAPISDDLAHYEAFLEIIKDKKHIVLLTKIDLTSKANLLKKLEIYQKYSSKFEAIIPISATKRVNLEQIFGAICAHLPNSPFLYDSEILTSTHIREIYREKIRESLFNFTNKEVPYSSEVRILRILESENITKIYAEIITEKTSQKKIIIGQGGKRIKNIGIDARKKIEEFSGERVFLSLNVVCERGWSKDKKAIEKMIGE